MHTPTRAEKQQVYSQQSFYEMMKAFLAIQLCECVCVCVYIFLYVYIHTHTHALVKTLAIFWYMLVWGTYIT